MTDADVAQRRPVNDPRATDLLIGVGASVMFFSVLVTVTYGIASTVMFPESASSWYLWGLFAWVISLIVGFGVGMIWGLPASLLLASLLRPTRDWRAHLAAYSGLGGVTGFLVWTLGGRAAGINSRPEFLTPDQLPWLGAVMALSAASTAAGWWCAWQRSCVSVVDDPDAVEEDRLID